MQTLFQKMRANRCRWVDQPIQPAEVQPAPEVPAVQPFMVVDGQRYVEATSQLHGLCKGCAFLSSGCNNATDVARQTFGRSCISSPSVIYIKAE